MRGRATSETRPLTSALFLALFLAVNAYAQDSLVITTDANHLRNDNGGGASLVWIHPHANDTFIAGATAMSLGDTRWTYATLGATHRVSARTTLNAEANLGAADGGAYIVLRGGATHELIAKRLYADAEWLHVDVAKQQDAIVRVGATYAHSARWTLRASVYESLFGDDDTTLAMLRSDYDFGRVTAIAGFSGGTAIPVLLQQAGGDATRVREAFGGVAFGAARRWTILVTAGSHRERLTLSCRLPLGAAR